MCSVQVIQSLPVITPAHQHPRSFTGLMPEGALIYSRTVNHRVILYRVTTLWCKPFKQFNHVLFTESTINHKFLHVAHMHLLILAKHYRLHHCWLCQFQQQKLHTQFLSASQDPSHINQEVSHISHNFSCINYLSQKQTIALPTQSTLWTPQRRKLVSYNHSCHHHLSHPTNPTRIYKPDALPVTQPTVSEY